MLTLEQIRPQVLHEDRYIRHAALEYLAGCWSSDETVIPDILKLSERYGDKANLHGLAVCRHFPVNEPALLGILDRLAHSAEEIVQLHLNRAVGLAPVDLLIRYNEAIQANPHILKETHERIRHRCEFSAWPGERLWEELQDFARRSESKQYFTEIDHDYADALVDALAPHDLPDVETICRLLREADEKDGDGWREIFLIDLAGERRLRQAIPILVGKFRIDSDYLLEQASTALAKIGDPEASCIIGETFLKESWDFKNYASGALGAIKSVESEEVILALLDAEKDVEIRTMLCHGLCQLFSERGIEVVRQQIEDGYDEMLVTLEDMLLPVTDVLGITLPESDRWRQEREEREAASERRKLELDGFALRPSRTALAMDEPEPSWVRGASHPGTYRHFDEKVGRNAPCPCGSGKKYKKCCGKN